MIVKIWKTKFENKTIEQLISRYFNIRNFLISKYWSFYVSSFDIFLPTSILFFSTLIIFQYRKFGSVQPKYSPFIKLSPRILCLIIGFYLNLNRFQKNIFYKNSTWSTISYQPQNMIRKLPKSIFYNFSPTWLTSNEITEIKIEWYAAVLRLLKIAFILLSRFEVKSYVSEAEKTSSPQ